MCCFLYLIVTDKLVKSSYVLTLEQVIPCAYVHRFEFLIKNKTGELYIYLSVVGQ